MQPTYLPWSGYFNLISQADKFVFLDDVQFERRSWQVRNRILMNGQEQLLTIPTKKVSLNTLIRDIEISNNTDWQRKHWLTLCNAYSGAPYGNEALKLLEPFFTSATKQSLSEFNQKIILHISDSLSLNTIFFRASDLECTESRSKHLIQILRRLECNEYLSPIGSKDYLRDDNFSEISDISLLFQDFQPEPYTQFRSNGFVTKLSIIDVIANIGIDKTKAYIS